MIMEFDPLGKIKVVPVHVTRALKGTGVNFDLGPKCRLMFNFTPPVARPPKKQASLSIQ